MTFRHFWKWKGHYIDLYKNADKHRGYPGRLGSVVSLKTERSGSQTSSQISEITSKICILANIPVNSYPTEVLDAIALMSCLGK